MNDYRSTEANLAKLLTQLRVNPTSKDGCLQIENMMKVEKSSVAKVTQFAVIILAGLHVAKELFQIIRVRSIMK